jgi:hypothetical protein
MSTWVNDDNLRVRFGTKLAETAKSGTASDNQHISRQMKGVIDPLSDGFVAFGDADDFLSEPTAGLPSGALIRSATLIVLETFTSGGAPTLDLGLKEQDGTEIDHDGLHAGVALGALTQGAEIAGAGALISTVTAANGYISINVDVADYTAGKAILVIDYILPQ